MNGRRNLQIVILLAGVLWLFASSTPSLAEGPGIDPMVNTPIEHFIVLMQENHTFDNYFGTYPGADGTPEGTCMPVDPFDPEGSECVEPFHIGDSPITDLDHSSSTHSLQYNEGKMNGFVYALNQRSQAGSLAMGFYDDRDLPYYWNLADRYVLFDRFFSSAHGGSVWNHLYWVTGAPGSAKNQIPLEGYSGIPTIFDRLEEKGISWKFYVQNYDPSLTFRILEESETWSPQIVWVPLLNFPRYLDDPELFSHIVDLNEFFDDLLADTLPAVAYLVPSGASEHPPGSIQAGQRFVKTLIHALMRSEAWYSSAFLVTYDDWGGWYDHVPPPQVDEYGYGFRVPAFMVSAYAREGYIDSTELDFTSILKFIEENWDLEPLAERDSKANNFLNAFDFTQPPRQPEFIPSERGPEEVKGPGPRRGVIYAAYGSALGLAGTIILGIAIRSLIIRRRARAPGSASQGKGSIP